VSAPLYGLLLAGGRSTRMGQDKAALAYHGRTQLEWAMELVAPFVERAFVSVRADQTADPIRARFEQIVDAKEDMGPIAGILAAQAGHPQAAWLVLACDLPYLDAATLDHLISARRKDKLATAYRSSHDSLPEPLCAIYEPASREKLVAYVAGGKQCPRKFLIQSDTHLLDEPNPRALDNVNTPAEHGAAVGALAPDAAARNALTLKVQYYALLREQARCREESVETRARNPAELYEELKSRHSFSLAAEMLRVAVNSEFAPWTHELKAGDVVVFIPPVAGG
jgi:molybdopterin-guanine dinucleotide biosynthesis protein A